ncbi:MAG: YigZ family protein [Chloroflexota bacterium]|jgi:uncharacterized YigZ family protein
MTTKDRENEHMVEQYFVPATQTQIEIKVSNSRFIASVAPAISVNDARAFISRMRVEFSDASHNVPAYIIGHGHSTIAHCHDDGEPSGTAGRPVLAVLQGSGLGDVVVVITRYFGGTKLGTGGLVRAYGDSVKAVLAVVPRAEKVLTCTVMVSTPYSLLERVRQLIEAHGGVLIEETFAGEITQVVRFPEAMFSRFQTALGELSQGQLAAVVVVTGEWTLMPVTEGDR